MADIRSLTYDKFYRGISQDDYTTPPFQVLYSYGLDLNSNSYSIGLDYNIELLRQTNQNDMLCWANIVFSSGSKEPIAAGRDGEVYKLEGDNNVADFTFSDTRDVVNMINAGGFIYFVRPSGSGTIRIGKMPETNTSLSGVTETISFSGDTIPNGTIGSRYPMFNFRDEFVLLGVGNTLVSIDIENNAAENYPLFTSDIVSITRLGSQFRIYSSDGQVAFWEFGNDGISESYETYDTTRGAINKGGVDFVVSGFNSEGTKLKLASGYQAPVIAYGYDSERLDFRKFDIQSPRPQSLTRIADTIYFIGETRKDGTRRDSLWSYGSKNKALGDAFQDVTTYDVGTDSVSIDSVFGFSGSGGDEVYMGISIGGVEQIARYRIGSSRRTTGYMVLNTTDGNDVTMLKRMRAIYVTVSGCSTDNTIQIEGSFDNGEYQTLRTITESGNSRRIEVNTTTQRFTDLNIRVTLTDGGSGTPRFHGLRVVYEIIEENA